MKTTTEKALALCHAIEAAGASEQLTACSVLASDILADVQKLEAATCESIPKKTPTELWQDGQTGAAFQAALWEADQLRARVAELLAVAKTAEKWAQLGLMDYLPEFAKQQFLDDWEKLEETISRIDAAKEESHE
jgi:hypothetical protein